MLQKFKVIPCLFILCLFELTLMTVSPVFAADDDGFTVCDNMPEVASKLSCFRDLARSLRAEVEDMKTVAISHEAAVDDAEGTKEALKLHIEEINGWLEDKDARIADLQEQLSTSSSEDRDEMIADLQNQLSTSSSELQDKDEMIADLQDQLTDVKINSIKGMSLEGLRNLISELVAAEEEMVVAEEAAAEAARVAEEAAAEAARVAEEAAAEAARVAEEAAAEAARVEYIRKNTRQYCTDRTREEGTCFGGRASQGFCSYRPFAKVCKDMKAMDPEWRFDQAFAGCDKEQNGEGALTGCQDPD